MKIGKPINQKVRNILSIDNIPPKRGLLGCVDGCLNQFIGMKIRHILQLNTENNVDSLVLEVWCMAIDSITEKASNHADR